MAKYTKGAQKNFSGVYKQPSSVSGLTIQDIMNLDSNWLINASEKELRQVTSRLVSASNKRISRMSYAERAVNPAVTALKKSGLLNSSGKLSIKKAGDRAAINRLRNAAGGFLRKESSTASGRKKHREMLKKITQNIVPSLSDNHDEAIAEMWQDFFEIYAPNAEIRDIVYNSVANKFEEALPNYSSVKEAEMAIMDELDRIMVEASGTEIEENPFLL